MSAEKFFRFGHGVFDAAIIDLDGTLVDTLGDFAVALRRSNGGVVGFSK